MQNVPQQKTQEVDMASIPTEGRPVVPERRYMYCLREWFAFVQEKELPTLVSPQTATAFMWERVFVKSSHSYKSTIPTVDQTGGNDGKSDADGNSNTTNGKRKRASKKQASQRKKKTGVQTTASEGNKDNGVNAIVRDANLDQLTDEDLAAVTEVHVLSRTLMAGGVLAFDGPADQTIELDLERDATIEHMLRCQLTPSALDVYMSALINLWRHQVDHEDNPHPTPRSSLYSKLLKAYRQLHIRKRKANHEDEGKGSDGDGIQSRKQLADIRQAFFCKGTLDGLRDLAAFDWGHGGLLRGDSQRELQISDMGVQYFEDSAISGPTPAVAFSCRITSSKTNKTMQQVGMFRARDWKGCPVGGQAMYWFSRLHCSTARCPHSDTSFPDLSQRGHWYEAFSSKNAYLTAGVQSRLYTHDGRRFGARVAIKSGAPDRQVERLSPWASDVKDVQYLDVLPEHAMRALAGHPPHQGTFFLARAVQVPRELMEMVFPMVEEWLDHFSSPGHINSDIAAVQWLQYLKELRLVFLQDIPHWRQLYPEHIIFQHPIFTDPDSPYHAYEKDALASTLSRDHEHPLRDASDAARSQHILEQVNRNTHRLKDVSQAVQDLLEEVREVQEDVDQIHGASLDTSNSGEQSQ
ncbi:hypothetical protein I350_01511 [Cryptococcus amylolentus CBS 6273]|uniref:Ndc10 domain-containing protein n=1 Tax=Cryptococcus amylolentus CBS 6273 TaxID=1296118 RepID=A0A1E3KF40_9TREE|nr:hypothetical protein I350_01511 [Cryptococcus amylolentus CBS 6273]